MLVLGNTHTANQDTAKTDRHFSALRNVMCSVTPVAVFTFYFELNKENTIDSSGEQSSTATLLLSITAVHISTYRR
jgi:hypothetical protein